MNSDILFTLALIFILVVVFPKLGVRDYRLLMRQTRDGDANARMKLYKGVLKWHWPITIGFMAWWHLLGNNLESIGLVPIAEGQQWIAIAVGILVMLVQVIYLTIISRNVDKLKEVKEQMGELINLAPHTPIETRLFDIVSITAGVCEEILYRGLLLAILMSLVGTWQAVAISSLIFGLGHAYQGISGIVKTGMIGLLMACLTVFSGSLFIAIVLHTVIDASNGRLMGRAVQMTTLKTV